MIPFYEAYSPAQMAYACFEQAALALVFLVAFCWYLVKPRPAKPAPIDTYAAFPNLDCEYDAWGYAAMRDSRLSLTVTIGG
jgi:hypothetical protein